MGKILIITGATYTPPTQQPDTPTGAQSITLSSTALNMIIGDTFQLTATVLPSSTTDKSVSWSSSSVSVATVTSYGLVKAIGEGSVKITARCGGVTAQCSVKVEAAAIKEPDVPLTPALLNLDFTNGNYLKYDGTLVSFDNFAVSDFTTIPSGASKLTGTTCQYYEQKPLVAIMCFYDASKKFLSYVDELSEVAGESKKSGTSIVLGGWGKVSADIPSTAKYVRVCYILDLGGAATVPDDYKTPKIYYQ